VSDRRSGAIAIVGMAGVFPGAPDVHRYWQNILARVDATGDPPPEWEAELYLDPDATTDDHPYCVKGGYLGPLAEFSPSEHGVMPSSVDGTEPDHFLALRAAHEALLDAGVTPGRVDGTRTEVIVGRGTYVNRGNTTVVQHAVMLDQVLRILKQLHPEHSNEELAEIRKQLKASLPPFHAETAAGLVPNIITGRIANRLDCMGTNYIVDAACASSIVAVDHAIRDLESGRCDLAVAGGVHASTPPPIVTIFCQLKAISPKGRIRPFSEEADGTLLGEGAGMVVLKRLEDAERDGDRIYAVLRGVGVASDGRAVGLLAPRLEGEELALQRAYEEAGVPPESVGLIEAHGTATTVGDAVEVEALARVFGARPGGLPRCAIGSVKSMIGHLMPASGIAGLIKTALALHHRVLPPTIGCERPNPKLGLDRTSFYLNTEPRPWIHAGTGPRRAGVNAFGFGGINAHAVLEEYVGPAPAPASSMRHWDTELFVLTAPSREGLADEADRLRAALATADVALKDIAYTLNTTRPLDGMRLAIVAGSIEELRAKLERAAAKLRDPRVRRIREVDGVYWFPRPLAAEGKVAFVFPGEGSQYTNMLADLCMHFPEVRAAFDFMDRAFADHPRGYLPSDVVFPRASDSQERLFGMDAGAEAVFTANQALAALLAGLGVRPDAVVGHSTGEHSALLVAGAVSVRDEAELRAHVLGVNGVYEQLQSGAGIPEGMLLATAGIDFEVLERLVGATGGQVHIAMDNCPHQVVLCGTREAIAALQEPLREHRAICQELPFARAYHTPWFDVFCTPLRAYFDRVTVNVPSKVPVYSCVTAAVFPADADAVRELVSTQWAKSVRFRETVEAMYRDGIRIFVEAGPRANLTGFIDDVLRGREYAAIASNVPHRTGVTQLNHLAGQLVAHGVAVNLERLYAHRAPVAIDLARPTLPVSRPRLPLKSGLQPMRLPASFARRAPAPAAAQPAAMPAASLPVPAHPPAPAPAAAQPAAVPAASLPVPAHPSAPAAPQVPVLARVAPVVDEHFRTMAQFLDVQARVMSAYLHRGNGNGHANGKGHGDGHGNGNGTGNGHAPRRLPFIDAVSQHEPGRSLTAVVQLDLARHRFFHDHTLGRNVSVEDPALPGLPVLPLTFSIEILAEAAAALVPGGVLTSIEQVRGYRWITVADRSTLAVTARARAEEPGAVEVSARQGGTDGQPQGPVLVEAVVRFAQSLPPAPQLSRFVPRGARASAWTADRLYRDGMFHGRAFQVVRSVDAHGEDGNTATLVAPAPRGLFADAAAPELLTEAVLLDAAGQVLAFWAKEHSGPQFDFFPFRVEAIRVFQPPPAPGAPVRCDVRASLVGTQQTTCDIDLVDGEGRAVYRIEGWEDRRFELPRGLLQLRIAPRETMLATPWDAAIAGLPDPDGLACCRIDSIPAELIEANHGIWAQMLAYLVLARRERAQWAALTGPPGRRLEWLLGRAAAKDAVRRLLQARHGLAVAAADVEILPDAYGRPEVHGAWRDRLGIAPVVSIAHSGGVAVALAALDGRPLVGIDIERISGRAEGFEAVAFGADERRLLSSLDEDGRREWHLRLWCAKEAVGKALGRGLAPGIRALEVTEARVADGAVRLRLAGSLETEFPAVARRDLVTFTTRDGDYVSSTIACA
jgi:acyl transferase domain-containing protein/phosphopantetheinyl transferase